MAETWVVNASPMIVLAKVGHLDLLLRLSDVLIIPAAVAAEIVAAPDTDPARIAMVAGWKQPASEVTIPDVVLEWSLGAGESSVLAHALEAFTATAVLDDLAARRAAAALGIPVIGTLGIILRAKVRGLIPEARSVIERVRAAGLYLPVSIIESALTQIGE